MEEEEKFIRYHNAFVGLQGVHHMWITSVLDSINEYHHLNMASLA